MVMRNPLLLVACIAVLAVVVPVTATGQQVVKQKDGTILNGFVTNDTGTQVTVRTKEGDVTITYSKLAPETVLVLREKRTPEDDGKAQLNLAEYALANNLFLPARRHFFMALVADASLKDQVLAGMNRVETGQRRYLMDLAAEARKSGNAQMESALLSHLMTSYPESEEAGKAEKMMEELQTGDDLEAIISRLPKEAQKIIEDGRKSFQEAIEYNQRGLKNSRKKSAAEADFNRALRKLRHCETLLYQIREEYEQNLELMKAANEAEKKIEDRQIQVLINLAHLYTQRQSFVKAMEFVTKALLVDENSPVAREARNNIELAMNFDRRGWRR